MATKVKPCRIKATGTPQVGDVPKYVDEDTFQWWTGWGGWWDVQVSTQTGNVLTSWMSIWAGLQTDYENLGTYNQNCLYLIIE